MLSGYYRYPTLYKDTVVFVCEDDLWTVSARGGVARRLTSNLGEVTYPFLSPDGSQIAFVGKEDGQPEVYVMPAQGGPARRLTYLSGSYMQIAGWTEDGSIQFASDASQPFRALLALYTIDPGGGTPRRLPYGPARAISRGPNGGVVLGRNTGDPARWKRYQGGTAGQLWIDEHGTGQFHPLLSLKGNLTSPIWLGERIYFLADHEGIGNLYSCLADGGDLRRHTGHTDFYARSANSDGKRIIYHAGADIFIFDPATGESKPVKIKFFSPQTQRNRKFVDAQPYLKEEALHPSGQALAICCRSLIFTFGNWEGAVIQHGDPAAGVRYRLPAWLPDGRRLVAVSDEGGEEAFIILSGDGSKAPERLPILDSGRADSLAVNPLKDQLVFSNHRYELCFLDLKTLEFKVIDRGRTAPISDFDWSPDGEWVVYSASLSLQRAGLKLWKASSGEITPLTDPVLKDVAPVFDPHGTFIYFLSLRTFNPVADNLAFDLNFPRGVKPYLITLQKDSPNPFHPRMQMNSKNQAAEKEEGEKEDPEGEEAPAETSPAIAEHPPKNGEAAAQPEAGKGEKKETEDKEEEEEKLIQIDLDGIQKRVLAFPVKEGRYGRIQGSADTKVFFSTYPVEGTIGEANSDFERHGRGSLRIFDFHDRSEELFLPNISDFTLGRDGRTILLNYGSRLRVVKTNFKPDGEDEPGRKSGWVNLDRISVPVIPSAEWRQMFREAWRLQRDQFWTADMSSVDWLAVYQRYLPLVERVGSRSEFSDLIWELQGELGTSHCYEMGGDYRSGPHYPQGSLGADFEYDEATSGWRIHQTVKGDSWDEDSDSPLNELGINIEPGAVILAINGRQLNRNFPPAAALVNLAHSEVALTLHEEQSAPGPGEKNEAAEPRLVTVKTLGGEFGLRYRQWVNSNRQRVHEASGNKVGYIHIPNMSASGFAEFHRGYLAEIDYPALVVDVRFNQGGNVSALLLEKLARRRLGYDVARWSQELQPYPAESVLGPIVAITNEHAASDGDIFSHGFKLLGLGPLIGKRTWGGVIGIWPRHSLVDGTITTQPEFSFWFMDVGWGVENYGTDPDIEVDITPQDYAAGIDTQLERAIQEALQRLQANPPTLPDVSVRPRRSAPHLPPLIK